MYDYVWASQTLVGPVAYGMSVTRGPVENNANVAACTDMNSNTFCTPTFPS